jgi:hypothetical protein
MSNNVALLLCGALAREVMALKQARGWGTDIFCVSAVEHMRPVRIAPLVERKLRELIPRYARVIVVYGDCGTGGGLDAVLTHYNVPRIAGPHCYEMYGGAQHYEALMAGEPGTFFLTDFLLRGFAGMVWRGLGIDRFPELRDSYFANYKRIVYLAQTHDETLLALAQRVSHQLNLPLEVQQAGYGELETRLVNLLNEVFDDRYKPVLQEAWLHGESSDSDFVLARHSNTGARAATAKRRRARTGQRATQPTLSRGN